MCIAANTIGEAHISPVLFAYPLAKARMVEGLQALLARILPSRQLLLGYISVPTFPAECNSAKCAPAPATRVTFEVARMESETAAMLAHHGSSELLVPMSFIRGPKGFVIRFHTPAAAQTVLTFRMFITQMDAIGRR